MVTRKAFNRLATNFTNMRFPTISFILREPKGNKITSIYISLRDSVKRVVINTKEKIHPLKWDKANQRVIVSRSNPEATEINHHLSDLRTRIEGLFEEQRRLNKPYDLQYVKDMIEGKKKLTDGHMELMPFIEQLISTLKDSDSTKSSYHGTYLQLKGYASKYRIELIWDSINQDWYNAFFEYLHYDGGHRKLSDGVSLNTFSKHIKNLKRFMRLGMKRGYHANEAFRDEEFKRKKEYSQKVFLDDGEVNSLLLVDFQKGSRECIVRDIFFCACHLGLRYSDFSMIRPHYFKTKNGILLFEKITKKTKAKVVIPVHLDAVPILEKYDFNFWQCPSNAYFNKILKQVCKKAGIIEEVSRIRTVKGEEREFLSPKYQLVTCHTARSSFICNKYKQGMPEYSIRKFSGHRSQAVFETYLRMTEEENALDMANKDFFR